MRQYSKIATLMAILLALFAITTRINNRTQAAPAPTIAVPIASATPAYGIPSTPDPRQTPVYMPTAATEHARGGIPGIRPSNPDAPLDLPTFTEQDIRDQIMTTGYWASQYRPSGPVAVASVEFLTPEQVDLRLRQPQPKFQGSLLCLVKLSGSFTRGAPESQEAIVSAHLYLLFDARTGKLYMTYQPKGEMDQ